ncbi:aromatic ring-hydroxylating oxygenase subunit alpha [Dyella caseinilytica]|uniref:Aromatic ring-hydroxylating dioxygenase subunit alpha n=1 Tax=Dyella caseinilytica TaxID=1849581 RepID=A0ABX7GSZ3_9GAMM|nr:aromatic ring-hydroxylating dioxygenase subunit alpha [Dyella caseinilytica]QRN53173.1 aromatic ring-hydroxylating dioxygenase subunit alpha [Dyella caseinilytica]GGA12028.1 3-phenylpropionate dioxygenase [Dyella caseinilytica]
MASKAEVGAYLRQGLRDLWYPVVASWEVSSAPLGITRLGENIVLWRDAQGQVHALEDRCPHRGARLSMGWNLGDRVACWYHGVEVGTDGVVKDVPAVNTCPLVGAKCIRSYPVQERHGAVFLYFAASEQSEATELTLPAELEDTEQYSHFLCTAAWKCGYEYAIDNVMDPMHGAYLHAASHSMADGDRSAEMQIVPTNHGFLFEKTGQRGVNFDWVEFGHSGTFWLRLSIPYRQQFGPGGPFWIVGLVVPVDEHHCRVFFWRIRKVQGWQRDTWRFMYRNRLEKLHWEVLEQDRLILEGMAADARDHEFLYAHDAGLTRVRRIMQKMAQAQLEQRAKALAEKEGTPA